MAESKNESHASREYWELVTAPVFSGRNVPRGDGHLVLIIPGLFGNDVYLHTLHSWLHRIGYRTALSSLTLNAGCPNRIFDEVERAFTRQLRHYNGEIAIIGHSRGGMIGKALLATLGDRCHTFIALGSPVGGLLRDGRSALLPPAAGDPGLTGKPVGAAVADAGRKAIALLDPDCNIPNCDCPYVNRLLTPIAPEVNVTAIYSVEDQVVSPKAARIDGATNIEVKGTHSGLAFNREVYPHIANALQIRNGTEGYKEIL